VLHGAEPSLLPQGQQQGVLQLIEEFMMGFSADGNVVVDPLENWSASSGHCLTSPLFYAAGFHFDPSLGTEELGHLEMVGAIIHQLTRNLKDSQIQDSAFAPYFVDHTAGVYPTAASGAPWNAFSMQVKGDPITDLTEDLGAEQKARTTYDNILRLSDDPDVNDVIKFLREREVVHFQRFGEAVQLLREKLNQKNVYYMNPAFDM